VRAGLDALNNHFGRRNFVFNARLTRADVALRHMLAAALLKRTGELPPLA
jgi:hypothetical protein